jgi:hypothetical protein
MTPKNQAVEAFLAGMGRADRPALFEHRTDAVESRSVTPSERMQRKVGFERAIAATSELGDLGLDTTRIYEESDAVVAKETEATSIYAPELQASVRC